MTHEQVRMQGRGLWSALAWHGSSSIEEKKGSVQQIFQETFLPESRVSLIPTAQVVQWEAGTRVQSVPTKYVIPLEHIFSVVTGDQELFVRISFMVFGVIVIVIRSNDCISILSRAPHHQLLPQS